MRNLLFAIVGLIFFAGLATDAFAQNDETIVILHTASGDIAIEFFNSDAPNHVQNFVQLAEDGFYDGTLFHRIIPGFMIQGGDPLTKQGESTMDMWGTGGPDKMISQEFNDIKHVRGIVSMARSNDPDSAGSQFFIVHADSTHLDGQYTAFGRIITQESFETLDKLAALETLGTVPSDWSQTKILSTTIMEKSQLPDTLDLESPARSTIPILSDDQLYQNQRLGIQFLAPAGWQIQEPEKTDELVPDVVAVTSGRTIINPSISVTISYANDMTLEQRADDRKDLIQPAVDAGQLEIIGEEFGQLFDRDTYTIRAIGVFQSANFSEQVQFTEITFLENKKFYALTYTTAIAEHDNYLGQLQNALESFTVIDSESVPKPPSEMTDTEDNGCLIATAAYGSEMSPQVQFLREIRDDTVLQTESGSAFMDSFNQFYYSFSPIIADWQRQNPMFNEAVRLAITPLISSLAILNHVEINSESAMIQYGVGIIMLNIGMYFAGPAIVVYRIFRK